MSRAALQHAPQSSAKSNAAATSLRIGPAHDSFEQEADGAAEKVTSGDHQHVAWSLSRVGIGHIQRQCSCGGTCDDCKKKKEVLQRNVTSSAAVGSHAPASVASTLSRSGSLLDPGTRSFMESRFGHDFSRVRIHTDEQAAASARDVSANAYTVGTSIVFNQGRYQPHSSSGRKLLAHELAHVVQQASAPPQSGSSLLIGRPDDRAEQAAHRAAQACEDARSSANTRTAGVLALSARVQGLRLQRYSYKEAKEDVYKGLIQASRAGNRALIALLRKNATLLPASLQGAANTLIDIDDVINGALIAVALAVVGIVVGAGEGVADLVRGLVALIAGAGKTIFDVITGFLTNFDAAKQDFNKFVAALVGLPGAIKAMVTNWLDRFEKASSERQSLMIGELTGQVIALIATWAVAAGRAGTVAKVASEGTEVLDVAATAADVTANAAKGTAAATDAASTAAKGSAAARAAKLGWKGLVKDGTRATAEGVEAANPTAAAANAASAASKGAVAASATRGSAYSAAAMEGNAALKLAPAVEQAPKFVPKIVPPPAVVPELAPAAATAVATVTGAGKAAAVGTGLAAAKAAQISTDAKPDREKKKKKKSCADAQPCGVLPIIWPDELPVPPNADLVRTKADLREVEGIERGSNQANFAACIRKWKNNPKQLDLESACPGRGFYESDLFPSAPIDAHHIHPLYLGGGDDIEVNLGAINTFTHRAGHKKLDDQQVMFETDPTWAQCKICSPRLSHHPPDQEYRIEHS